MLFLSLAHAETLTFDAAVSRLHAESLELAQAEERVRLAKAQATQTRALFLPSVTANAYWLRNDSEIMLDFEKALPDLPFEMEFPDPIVFQPLDSLNAAGSVTVPLLAPAAWVGASAAGSAVDAADAGYLAARNQLDAALLQVAAAGSVAEGILGASERGLETAQAHLAAAQRAEKAGLLAPVYRMQAEADVLRREQDVAKARADVEAARRAAGVLLAADGPVTVELPAGVPTAMDEEIPEVVAADAMATAARRKQTAQTLTYVPVVGAVFTAMASDEEFLNGENTAWKLQLGLQWTLFDGGAREGRIAEAAAQRRAAEAQAESARLRAAQAVADATDQVELAKVRKELAEKQLVVAREAERISRRGMEEGNVGAIDARDAAERAFLADVAAETAKAGVLVAEANLRRARGGGW